MAKPERFLSDEQWQEIEPLLPKIKPGPKGGRRRVDNREVLESIF